MQRQRTDKNYLEWREKSHSLISSKTRRKRIEKYKVGYFITNYQSYLQTVENIAQKWTRRKAYTVKVRLRACSTEKWKSIDPRTHYPWKPREVQARNRLFSCYCGSSLQLQTKTRKRKDFNDQTPHWQEHPGCSGKENFRSIKQLLRREGLTRETRAKRRQPRSFTRSWVRQYVAGSQPNFWLCRHPVELGKPML